MAPPALRILPDADRLAAAAAEEFVRAALAAVAERGRFAVALAGGSTPIALYRLLARRGLLTPPGPLPWGQIHWFWGDERAVPPDDPRSNYGAAREALLRRIEVPAENVHRVRGELADAEDAARLYEDELRTFFAPVAPPRFDLVLLGLGADGHTASLFPGSAALAETVRWVVAPWIEPQGERRITLTLPVLNASRRVLFLVGGAEKAVILRRVLRGPRDPASLPAQAIAPADGELVWLCDRAAAARMEGEP